MPFKRPGPLAHTSSSGYFTPSEGSRSSQPPSKRTKLKLLPELKVYIVQAKLDSPTIAELFLLAERNCEKLCSEVEEADVVVTAIGMRKRLERHIPWEVAKTKAIVTPDWLRDSAKEGKALPCEPYVAVEDLYQQTLENCPDCNLKPCGCDDTDEVEEKETPLGTPVLEGKGQCPSPPESVAEGSSSPQCKPQGFRGTKAQHDSRKPSSKGKAVIPSPNVGPSTVKIPAYLLPPDAPIHTNMSRLSHSSRYSCQRASPLICPNQALAVQLDIIRRSRALEGEDRSALSYARAISAIKAYPHVFTSRAQAAKLPHIGTKIIGLVEEFLDTGKISEARRISASSRFQALTTFSSIYGIGPNTARKLQALNLQSLDDLEAYYGVDREEVLQGRSEDAGEGEGGEGRGLAEVEGPPREKWWPGKGKEKNSKGKAVGGHMVGDAGGDLGESWIRIALGLREDLAIKIPRAEAEEMNRVVMHELDEIEPGCISTIVGGYRRGKPESNDMDIVFTHPDATKVKGLCKRLVRQLYERGMISHVMHLSNFRAHNALRPTHWDSLEKALTVFILPSSSPFYKERNGHGIRRRLDLIFARPEVYWTAVIGWSGSIMFQRDLRQWAKDKFGMKFDSSGITRRYDSKQFYPRTEKEVFDLFGLEWVDPVWRNADL